MSLESIIRGTGRVAGRAIRSTARVGGKAVSATAKAAHAGTDYVYQNSPTFWSYAKPVTAGLVGFAVAKMGADIGLDYLSNTWLFDQAIPSIVEKIPNLDDVNTVNPIANYLAHGLDNAISFVVDYTDEAIRWGTSAGAGLYLATRRRFQRDPATPRTGHSTWKKIKSTIGLGAFLTAAAMAYTAAPEIHRAIKSTYRQMVVDTPDMFTRDESEVKEEIDLEETDKNKAEIRKNVINSKELSALAQYIQKQGSVSRNRMKSDAAQLRNLGYDITDRDLFYVTRVVAGEAGNYFGYNNWKQKQSSDMNWITHAIINRYTSAEGNEGFKDAYAGTRVDDPDLRHIVLKRKQFSIANSSKRRARWEASYDAGNLTHGSGRVDRAKTNRAYYEVVRALIEARLGIDPTGGAVNYKNNKVRYASRKIWNGSRWGNNTMRFNKRNQDHWYYGLYDSRGNSVVTPYRQKYFAQR
jgi:hypothetical protein